MPTVCLRNSGQFVIVEFGQFLIGHVDASGGGRVQTAQEIHQGGLARARGAGNAQEATLAPMRG